MRSDTLAAFLIWILVIISTSSCNKKAAGITDDEYAVYKVVIDTLYTQSNGFMDDKIKYEDVVLIESTGLESQEKEVRIKQENGQYKNLNPFDGTLKLYSKVWQKIDSAYMQASFEKMNSDRCPLDIKRFGDSFKFNMLSRGNFEEYFTINPSEGWKNFYEDYPGSLGVLSFSRAAFNKNRNICLLYFEYYKDLLDTSGNFIFLVKHNKQWTIMEVVTDWIS